MRGLVLTVTLAFVLLTARGAQAFCGFYVSGADAKLFANASQVVLMREGTRTVLSMQNDYQGPPESFAMVVPVPVVLQKENVKTLPREIFTRIDQLDAPRLVEYWERDPCARGHRQEGLPASARRRGGAAPKPSPAPRPRDLGVTIEAQFTVGEYEIVVLGAKDSSGLDTWLRHEGYKIPRGQRAVPASVRGERQQVLRREGRRHEGEDGERQGDALAAALPLRRAGPRAADPSRAA